MVPFLDVSIPTSLTVQYLFRKKRSKYRLGIGIRIAAAPEPNAESGKTLRQKSEVKGADGNINCPH